MLKLKDPFLIARFTKKIMFPFDEITFVLVIFDGIVLIFIIMIYIKEFCDSFIQRKHKNFENYKIVYIATMITIFCWTVSGFMWFSQMITKLINYHNNFGDEIVLSDMLSIGFYSLSILMTLGIYIIRIHIAFIGSYLEYTKRTLYLIKLMWICIFILNLFGLIGGCLSIGTSISWIGVIFGGLLGISYVVFMAILFYMFITRLKRVTKLETNEENSKLQNIIVKLMNLYTVNIVSTSITIIVLIMAQFIPGKYPFIVADLMLNIDCSYVSYMYVDILYI